MPSTTITKVEPRKKVARIIRQGAPGAAGADGADGNDGADGVSVTGALIDGYGHLIITLSVGDPIDVGLVVGSNGVDGADGVDGANGSNGDPGVSIVDAVVNGSGHLILYLSSLDTIDSGLVVGADGVSITGASIDGSYHLILTLSDTSTIDAGYVRGPAGADGAGSGDMLKSAYDSNDDGKVNSADSADSVPWSGVTSKPTTLSGYGITDAMSGAGTVTAGNPVVFADTSGKAPAQVTFATFKASLSLVKADVGLGNVDNTSDANKPVSTAQQTALDLKADLASPALTGTPTAPTASATTNTTQIATTAMVQAALAAYIAAQDVLVFKGVINCSTNPNYPAADAGHVYKVSVAGKIGGGSGPNVEVGDVLTCLTDSTASGNHATVGANWIISQVNIDGAVTGPTSATDATVAGFNGTTGKIVKQLSATEIRAAAGLATSDSPQFAGINLGNASDTTLARSAAGRASIEGVDILLVSGMGITLASGVFSVSGTASAGSSMRLYEDTDNGTNYVGWKAPNSITANIEWTMPSADGTSGQALMTDGAGTTYFGDAGGLQIGDILMTMRDPGASYLACDGSVYLKSSYTALVAAMGTIDVAWSTPTKISNPATLPTGSGFGAAWSPSGRYQVVAHSTTPFVTIYDWDSGSPVKITNPSNLPAGNATGAAWSPDSRYLAISHATSPYVTIYDFQSGSPVKISNPATLPASSGSGVGWSPSGRWMAVAHDSSPYVTIYDWNSGSPVKISNPATLPAGNATGAAFSPNSRYLAVSHTGSPYVTIYDFNSGSPVKISNPASLPAGTGLGVAFSPSGKWMAVGHSTTPFVTIYDWSTGSPVKITNPASLPASTGLGVVFSPDSQFLVVAHDTTPFVAIYDFDTGVPVKLSNPGTLPPATGRGAVWSPDGRYAAVVHDTSPYVTTYDGWSTLGYNPTTEFKLPDINYGWVKAA